MGDDDTTNGNAEAATSAILDDTTTSTRQQCSASDDSASAPVDRNPLKIDLYWFVHLETTFAVHYKWTNPEVWTMDALLERVQPEIDKCYRPESVKACIEHDYLDLVRALDVHSSCERLFDDVKEDETRATLEPAHAAIRRRHEFLTGGTKLRLKRVVVESVLHKAKNGELRSHEANVAKILELSHETSGLLRWNTVTRAIEVTGGRFASQGTNGLDVAIARWLADEWSLFVGHDKVGAQILFVAQQHAYDPVSEYLESLKWDGTPRIDTWLADYCHVASTDYARKIGARWLISGAARGLKPGEKVDTVLILKGEQGLRKSTCFDVLGGEWFSDSPLDLTNKDARISSASTWIVELAELAALGQAGLEKHKAFLSARKDRVRPPYGRADETFLRHAVFAGTTNDTEFLIDDTGNRRYWVAQVDEPIEIEALRRDRHQLWAEAVYRYKHGERWWFDDFEQIAADDEADKHRKKSAFAPLVKKWYQQQQEGGRLKNLGKGVPDGAVKLADVAEHALRIPTADLNRRAREISTALKDAGFFSKRYGSDRSSWWVPAAVAVDYPGDE